MKTDALNRWENEGGRVLAVELALLDCRHSSSQLEHAFAASIAASARAPSRRLVEDLIRRGDD